MAPSEDCREREQRQENKQTTQQSAASGAALFRQNKFFDEGLGSDRRLRIDNGVALGKSPSRSGSYFMRIRLPKSQRRKIRRSVDETLYPRGFGDLPAVAVFAQDRFRHAI
jgi:hypothetical protein